MENFSVLECAICYNMVSDPVNAPCGHGFCRPCILQSLTYNRACPTCRANVPWSWEFRPNHLVNSNLASIQAQREELLASRLELLALRDQIRTLEESMADAQEETTQLWNTVGQLQRDKNGLHRQNQGLQRDVTGLKDEVTSLRRQGSDLEAEIAKMGVCLAAKDRQLVSNEQESAEKNKKLDIYEQLLKTVSKHNNTVAGFAKKLSKLKK